MEYDIEMEYDTYLHLCFEKILACDLLCTFAPRLANPLTHSLPTRAHRWGRSRRHMLSLVQKRQAFDEISSPADLAKLKSLFA